MKSGLSFATITMDKLKAATATSVAKINMLRAEMSSDDKKAEKLKTRALKLDEYAASKREHAEKISTGEIDVTEAPLPEE